MRPFKRAKSLANWLLRLSIAGLLVLMHYRIVMVFDYKVPEFYFSLIFLLLAAMLLIGGLLSSSGLTVFSGLFIFLLEVYFLIVSLQVSFDQYLVNHFISASLGFYFLTTGNKN